MLILTRKQGQEIVIGDDIKVVLLESKGTTVKIGIEAPVSTSVHRREVYDRIQQIRKQQAIA